MAADQGRRRYGPRAVNSRGVGLVVQFAIFIGMFFSLSFLLNYYVLFHLSFMLHVPHNLYFWIGLVISSASWFMMMGLAGQFDNAVTRALHVAAAVWMGFLIYAMFVLFGYDILRLYIFHHLDAHMAAIVVPSLVLALTVVSLIVPFFVRVRRLELPAPRLGRDLRVVQLTDLHIGTIHPPRELRKLIRMANAERPDLVLITGDLADGPSRYTDDYFSALDDIESPAFFTTGNHEYYAGLETVLGLISKTKVRVLRNETVEFDGVQIIGLDDGLGGRHMADSLSRIPHDRSRYTILMYHQPAGFKAAQAEGVDLMLSGHTHGGQFYPFPILAWLVWPMFTGLHEYRGSYLFTSMGSGTWGPPFRLGTRSEIAVVTLKGRRDDGEGRTA